MKKRATQQREGASVSSRVQVPLKNSDLPKADNKSLISIAVDVKMHEKAPLSCKLENKLFQLKIIAIQVFY